MHSVAESDYSTVEPRLFQLLPACQHSPTLRSIRGYPRNCSSWQRALTEVRQCSACHRCPPKVWPILGHGIIHVSWPGPSDITTALTPPKPRKDVAYKQWSSYIPHFRSDLNFATSASPFCQKLQSHHGKNKACLYTTRVFSQLFLNHAFTIMHTLVVQ